MRLNDIHPNDFPNRKSWDRVLARFPSANKTLLNLDTIKDDEGQQAVVITKGGKYGFSARNGNHTLARILSLFGAEAEVTFTPNTELRDWHAPGEFQEDVDWRIEIVSKWGAGTFIQFLEKCLQDEFYQSNTDEMPLW